MARVTIISDAWIPQINGAVTTLVNTVENLELLGHTPTVIEPSEFVTWPCPTYPEIPLARTSPDDVIRLIEHSRPDYVLIAVEGPLGIAARRALVPAGIPFSTAAFTRFQDYLWTRFKLPHGITLRALDWFHRPAGRVLTPSPTMQKLLAERGLTQTRIWRPGVDHSVFRPVRGKASEIVANLPGPLHLYVGRLAIEKNVEAFLDLDLAGSKIVVGDGPARKRLQARCPEAVFLGYRTSHEIAEICSVCDVMVFPSTTDTFGHVIVEALACGLPVAAFNVQGPRDILTDPAVGAMDDDLGLAIAKAMACDRDACVVFAAQNFSWSMSTQILMRDLAPVGGDTETIDHVAAADVSGEHAPVFGSIRERM